MTYGQIGGGGVWRKTPLSIKFEDKLNYVGVIFAQNIMVTMYPYIRSPQLTRYQKYYHFYILKLKWNKKTNRKLQMCFMNFGFVPLCPLNFKLGFKSL